LVFETELHKCIVILLIERKCKYYTEIHRNCTVGTEQVGLEVTAKTTLSKLKCLCLGRRMQDKIAKTDS
jgi:hypothetical protein